MPAATLAPASIDVWVTPPAYTGMAPLFLKVPGATGPMTEAEVIRIPVGSAVLAQVYGVEAPPRLLVGSKASDFASLGIAEGGTGYRAEVEIHSGDRLAIRAGLRTLASWPIEVVPDRVPEVQFTALPDTTADGLLRVGYEARDDYGIAAVTMAIHRRDDEDGVRVSMPLANPGASAVEGQSQHDLTSHRWAGFEVSIRLEIEDAAGQTGLSSAVSVVLPERPFSHPVARAVIELDGANADGVGAKRETARGEFEEAVHISGGELVDHAVAVNVDLHPQVLTAVVLDPAADRRVGGKAVRRTGTVVVDQLQVDHVGGEVLRVIKGEAERVAPIAEDVVALDVAPLSGARLDEDLRARGLAPRQIGDARAIRRPLRVAAVDRNAEAPGLASADVAEVVDFTSVDGGSPAAGGQRRGPAWRCGPRRPRPGGRGDRARGAGPVHPRHRRPGRVPLSARCSTSAEGRRPRAAAAS